MIQPIHDYVLVRPTPEIHKGLIEVVELEVHADHHKRETKIVNGEVVATGPRCESINPGDEIIYSSWVGAPVKSDGEDLLMMNESDLKGVVDKTCITNIVLPVLLKGLEEKVMGGSGTRDVPRGT